jgi:hypothetical protein
VDRVAHDPAPGWRIVFCRRPGHASTMPNATEKVEARPRGRG